MYECVCEWVNLTCVVKLCERSVDWKSAIESPFSPFTKTVGDSRVGPRAATNHYFHDDIFLYDLFYL